VTWIQILATAAALAALGAGIVLLRMRAARFRPRRAAARPSTAGAEKLPGSPGASPDPGHRGGAGLQGTLAQTPLHDLLQYLSLGRKSGILELVSGRRAGRVVLQEGSVCKNSYRGKEGMEAMFMMMDLPEGDFEFYEQAIEEAPSQARLEVVDLIMLWMDRKPKKKA